MTKVEWTFTEVLDAVERLSTALQIEFDLQKGQVVALALPNSAEFIISVLAVSRCGGVASLINPGYTARKTRVFHETQSYITFHCLFVNRRDGERH